VSNPDTGAAPRRTSGLLTSAQQLLATFVEILHTRIEIATTELQEAGEGARQLLILAVAAIFFLALGVLFASLFIVVLFWETHPLAAVGALTLLYLGLGAGAAYLVYQRLKNRPQLFSTTLAELRKDRLRLTSRP
jgi:uncharacterized membrane protein YqjE